MLPGGVVDEVRAALSHGAHLAALRGAWAQCRPHRHPLHLGFPPTQHCLNP